MPRKIDEDFWHTGNRYAAKPQRDHSLLLISIGVLAFVAGLGLIVVGA